MAAVNAMKRRQMALWSPRNAPEIEGKAPMTPEERLQHDIAVNEAFVNVFSTIIKESPRTLADSRHAPKKGSMNPTKPTRMAEHSHGAAEEGCQHQGAHHGGKCEHDYHFSTALAIRDLSPHSRKLRDEAFQRVCSGFTEGEPQVRPPPMRGQSSTAASSNKAIVTSLGPSVRIPKGAIIENIPPMMASTNPKLINDLTKLTQESNETYKSLKSTEASPPTTKRPSYKPVPAESAKSGINKSTTSSLSSNTKPSEAPIVCGEYVPPHLRIPKASLRPLSVSHDVTEPASLGTSIPNSTKSDSPNTAGTSGETLPPHLRSIKQKNTGLKPSPTSTSSTLPSADNARDAKVSQKPLDVVSTKPAISTPASMPSMRSTADAAPVKVENLEHALYFGAWPKTAERDAVVSQVRKIIITKLPPDSKLSFVASLVYGGPLEEIVMIGPTTAAVMFLNPDDCARYHTATANGIVYGKDTAGRELVAFTEISKDVNVIGGLLKGFIEAGVTRCIKCIGVEEEWSIAALTKMAERKNRKLEGIEEIETRGGARAITFRFCKVADAVAFNGVLRRDEEFEQCNTMYSTDPCAIATDVHFDE